MAKKRNPELTARNKKVKAIKDELKLMEDDVLEAMGSFSLSSLHGIIGGKHADYINIKNEVIQSSDHFISLWLQGFRAHVNALSFDNKDSNIYRLNELLMAGNENVRNYLYKFLTRTYIKSYESLSKKRPSVEESEVWIGQSNAEYGLFVTPRFENGVWENDKSEIRHFKPKYWSIGHVLSTGFVILGRNYKQEFQNIEEYLHFFLNVLVRNSGSNYEYELAEKYCDFVRGHDSPMEIPLLIPEFRYKGKIRKHGHRLDFTIIDSKELNKIGFELSPWSSHGYIAKTKELNQKQINEIAKDNFEYEMKKHKDYFRKHAVFALIYTDRDLKDLDELFNEMKKYLEPKGVQGQLQFQILDDFFGESFSAY
ncbi:MAG: hypothetical protein QNK23_12295 [Crocinitomicaceae bacterium]|nr:hypothetical protein [Crocinitomicaceae bacterium]